MTVITAHHRADHFPVNLGDQKQAGIVVQLYVQCPFPDRSMVAGDRNAPTG